MNCIITGGNSGIGKSAAIQIANRGVCVVLACRNFEKAQQACQEITDKTGNPQVYAMKVDLSRMEEVKHFIADYTKRFGALDILINNAADFDLSRKKPVLSSEGNEVQFATNHLAPFAFVQGFLPLLRASNDGRIINIASKGLLLYPSMQIDFSNLNGEKSYTPDKAYYQSKLAQVVFSNELKKRLHGFGISVYCIRVTNVKVDIARYDHIAPILKFLYEIKSRFSISPDEMAKAYTELALGEKRSGLYYDENLNEVSLPKSVNDAVSAQKLWDLSLQKTSR